MAATRFFKNSASGLAAFFNSETRLRLLAPLVPQVENLKSRFNRPLRILDIGCGTGMHAQHFAKLGHHVVGVDQAEEMISEAQKTFAHPNVKFIRDELPELKELANQKFDVIYSIGVWQYVEPKDREKTMQRKLNLLNEGGLFAVIWPLPRSRDFQHKLSHDDITQSADVVNATREIKVSVVKGEIIKDPDNRKGFIETNEDVYFHTTFGYLPQLILKDEITSVATPSLCH